MASACAADAIQDVSSGRQAFDLNWIKGHHKFRDQRQRVALASLNHLTTGMVLPNWSHGRQPILSDEGETEALPKHR